MKTIIINDSNLKESDMTETVQRVKIIIRNSSDELLFGYSHRNYQLPGGHVEKGEMLLDTVKRELMEETGIEFDTKGLKPFACNYGYYKDWPETGRNRKIEIYYYEIITDLRPDLSKTNYTANEKDGNFELRYINASNVIEVIKDNTITFGDERGIAKEMVKLLDIYFNK